MGEKGSKSNVNKLIFVIAIIVCIIAAIYVGRTVYSYIHEQNQYEDLSNAVTLEEIENTEFTGERDGDAPVLPSDVLKDGDTNPIDFAKLQSYNSELVAWVRIPDTNIDYPIARHAEGDQTYYLSHNMYQEPAYAGCIFMENVNAGDFTDNNTVLYGHNMKNGSMFRDLHEYAEADFFNENQYIYVYTPGHALTYQVFAAYTYDDTRLTLAFDFSNDEIYSKYIEDIENIRAMDANIREDVQVTGEDKIITLSTCVGGQTEKRYLVQGVLINDVQTEEE